MSSDGFIALDEQAGFLAWRWFLRAQSVLAAGLDKALRRQAGLSLTWYDVLVHIGEAPQQRIRLRDLEERVFFSQSTVSRLAVRLECAGLIERCIPDTNRRTVEISLTASGTETLRAARAVAMAHIREHFLKTLRPGEAERMIELFQRLSTARVDGT